MLNVIFWFVKFKSSEFLFDVEFISFGNLKEEKNIMFIMSYLY